MFIATTRKATRPRSPATQVDYFLGLDLGQSKDYTALAITERHGAHPAYNFQVRHLQRWQLGTSYPAIVADVAETARRTDALLGDRQPRYNPLIGEVRQPEVVVDATGVGAPVTDLFQRERLPAKLRRVVITGGDTVSVDSGSWRIPKRELVSIVQVLLQGGRLKVAPELPEATTLVRELENFQVKISIDTAHDSYGAWREGTHDDLVLAVALSLWFGMRPPMRIY
jgi:hypothetical protein